VIRRLWPLLVALAASAHDVKHPLQEALRLTPQRIFLRVDYEVAAGEGARALRQAFDRNHDGALDPGEQHDLAEHLARTATLRTKLTVDGLPVSLQRDAVRPEKTDFPPTSDALLAARIELSGPWPPGTGNWLGRRKLVLTDEDPSGHVSVSARCDDCRIIESNSGLNDHGQVVVASTPLELLVKP
jgi:hypothetical protein